MKLYLDRIGSFGLVVIALASPCCFPLFGILLASFGLGSFELLGGWTMWVFEGLVLISLVGLYISYRKHQCLYPLIAAIPSALIIFYSYHFNESESWMVWLYVGMFGLLAASAINFYRMKLHQKVETSCTITCPNCGHKKEETMPVDACRYFYECENCHGRLKPLQGDCCVYCSYGTVKCPPVQQGDKCC